MREHDILPEQHTLWIEDEHGQRVEAHREFEPNLLWSGLAAGARDIADGNAFSGCTLVAASAAHVALLERFEFDPPGLEEVEERLENGGELKRAA